MTGEELICLLNQAYCRSHIIGTKESGIIVACDLEGRFFTVVNNQVVSKVNSSAILKRSNRTAFQNPGGDVLWPAPEGTCFGYEYSTGNWRVPSSITGATWEIASQSENKCVIRAEVDLINNIQVGLPCEFERHIQIEKEEKKIIQKVKEVIRYIGKRRLNRTEFSLAPWSLCQLDSTKAGKIVMPAPADKEDIWDIYANSEKQRNVEGELYVIKTETSERFQLGLSENISWIEYISEDNYSVKRYARPLLNGQNHIDISDVSPDISPSDRKTSLSIYCDPSGFVEIEACGGCTDTLVNGTELVVDVITEFNTPPAP